MTAPDPKTPSVPRAPVVAEGDESRPSRPASPPVGAKAGPDVPEGGAAVPGEGEPRRSRPPGSTEALSGEEGRKAWQAAISARNKAQRQGRARPRRSRDPYSRAVPGGVKPPPKDVA